MPKVASTIIPAFLAAVTCRGETEYSKPLGGDDDVLVRYSMVSGGGSNLLFGKIYNRSRYPLDCQVAADEALNREIRFNPGDTKEIQGGVPLPKVVFWDIQCRVPMRYKFDEKGPKKLVSGNVAVVGSVDDGWIGFMIVNLGTTPIEFNWPAVSFIGTDRDRRDIARLNFDADVHCCERQPLLPVTIPPKANLSSAVIPAANVRGQYPRAILAGEIAPNDVDKFILGSKHQTVGVYIDIVSAGKRIPITLEFVVSGAEPMPWTGSH